MFYFPVRLPLVGQAPFVISISYINKYDILINMTKGEVSESAVVYSRRRPSPRLETIRMVEDFIREWSGHYKRRALWENLPKKMMYQTYREIILYLLESKKIAIDSEGYVGWIFDSDLYERYAKRPDLRIR